VSSFLSLDLEEDDKPAEYITKVAIIFECQHITVIVGVTGSHTLARFPQFIGIVVPRDIPSKAVHVARLYIVSILLFKRQSADLELSFPCRLERLKSKDRNPSDALAVPTIEPVRSASTYV